MDYRRRPNGLPGDIRDYPEEEAEEKRRVQEANAAREKYNQERVSQGRGVIKNPFDVSPAVQPMPIRPIPAGQEARPAVEPTPQPMTRPALSNFASKWRAMNPGANWQGGARGSVRPPSYRPVRPLGGTLRSAMALKTNENKDQLFGGKVG
jgi:hypothetical protein